MTCEPEQVVWIARHGTRVDNIDPAWKATAERPFDPELAPQGVAEAWKLARRLEGERIDFVYASPFLRAVQTAAPIAEIAGNPIRIEPGFGEWMLPMWFESVPELLPEAEVGWSCSSLDTSYVSPFLMRCPEVWEEMIRRTGETIRRVAADGCNLVVVGHGASVIGSVAGLLGIDQEHTPPPPIACLYRLARNGDDWRVELDADTGHL